MKEISIRATVKDGELRQTVKTSGFSGPVECHKASEPFEKGVGTVVSDTPTMEAGGGQQFVAAHGG